MYHAFLTGCELDECTEFLDAYYLALEDLAFFEVSGDDLHHLQSLIHHFLIGTADRYLTIIGDIYLHAGTCNDLIDGLTTLTYYITDSVGIDLNGDDLGSVLANLCSGSRDSGLHAGIHDEQSCITASCDSAFYDRSGQTVDLNIHLNSGNTFGSTGYLKVHISKEVFQSLDIGQQYEIVIGLAGYQTTGDTCYHLLDGYACCHQGHAGSTGGSHGGGSVGFKGLRYGTNCIRELVLTGQYRDQGSLSQSAVTDLTSSGSAGRLGLTYGIGREVIMMHISLAYFVLIQAIDLLLLGQRSQSTYITDLCLSTGEHSGTMYTGDDIYLCCQRTDLGDRTTIGTLVVLQDHLTNGLLLILIYSLT